LLNNRVQWMGRWNRGRFASAQQYVIVRTDPHHPAPCVFIVDTNSEYSIVLFGQQNKNAERTLNNALCTKEGQSLILNHNFSNYPLPCGSPTLPPGYAPTPSLPQLSAQPPAPCYPLTPGTNFACQSTLRLSYLRVDRISLTANWHCGTWVRNKAAVRKGPGPAGPTRASGSTSGAPHLRRSSGPSRPPRSATPRAAMRCSSVCREVSHQRSTRRSRHLSPRPELRIPRARAAAVDPTFAFLRSCLPL